jgi:hypothetical protein
VLRGQLDGVLLRPFLSPVLLLVLAVLLLLSLSLASLALLGSLVVVVVSTSVLSHVMPLLT